MIASDYGTPVALIGALVAAAGAVALLSTFIYILYQLATTIVSGLITFVIWVGWVYLGWSLGSDYGTVAGMVVGGIGLLVYWPIFFILAALSGWLNRGQRASDEYGPMINHLRAARPLAFAWLMIGLLALAAVLAHDWFAA